MVAVASSGLSYPNSRPRCANPKNGFAVMILRGGEGERIVSGGGVETRTRRGEEEKEPSRRIVGKQEVQEGLSKVGGRESKQNHENREVGRVSWKSKQSSERSDSRERILAGI